MLDDERDFSKDVFQHLQNTNAFISKVYSILTAQLLLTTIMTAISMLSSAVRDFQTQNPALYIICFVVAFAVELVLICCTDVARKVPHNYILLTLFTVCQGYIISWICSLVMESQPDGGQIVLMAACLTFALVGGLTCLATYLNLTRKQFSYVYFILFVCLIGLIGLGIANIFIHSQFLNTLYCAAGVIIFGIYLVIDSAMIMKGGRYGITIDDYILGALILYIDIINLFIFILRLLSRR